MAEEEKTTADNNQNASGKADAADARVEHYEEVSEYRIGEGPPPLPLIIAFVLIVIWASISWIPFFGY